MFHIGLLPPYRDWTNVARLDLLFNDHLDEKEGCRVSYLYDLTPTSDGRRLILDDSKDSSEIGHPKKLENPRCSVEREWDGRFDIPVTFKPSFFGAKHIYVKTTDDHGHTSGWKQVGTRLASDERPPKAVSVVPYLGAGTQRTFTFALSDLNGSTDITNAEFLVQFGRTRQQACSISLDRAAGRVTLREDQGAAPRGSLELGEHRQIGNSQCTISDPNLILEGKDAIAFSVNITFSASFSGPRNIYAQVEDRAGVRSSLEWLGSWLVPK